MGYGLIAAALGIGGLLATQASQGQANLVFEAASVKPNTSGERSLSSPRFQGTTFTALNVPVEMLITTAYGLPVFSRDLVDLPSWVKLDMGGANRYDVIARAPEGSSLQEQRAMLRSLLENRFGLRVRRETRQLPVYFLTKLDAGGTLGPNLRRAAKDCLPRTACEGRTNGADSSYRGAEWSIVLQTIGAGLDGRLVDRAGLSGVFDFELTFSSRGLSVAPADSGIDIFGAVRQQLGLKLEPGRAPFEVMVVESVKRPSPN